MIEVTKYLVEKSRKEGTINDLKMLHNNHVNVEDIMPLSNSALIDLIENISLVMEK